jgi:hypothetical protein
MCDERLPPGPTTSRYDSVKVHCFLNVLLGCCHLAATANDETGNSDDLLHRSLRQFALPLSAQRQDDLSGVLAAGM